MGKRDTVKRRNQLRRWQMAWLGNKMSDVVRIEESVDYQDRTWFRSATTSWLKSRANSIVG